MATFGYTTIGGTSEALGADTKWACLFTSPADINLVDSISVYANRTAAGGGYAIRGGIYTDSAGSPDALVANSDFEISANIARNAPAWYTGTYSTKPALSANTPYWLCVGAAKASLVYFDAGVAGQQKSAADTYSDGLANPYGSITATHADKQSIYVSYTPVSADRRGIVIWSEIEIPLGPRRGIVTWSELEAPLGPRRGIVTWSELEIPLAPRRGLVTWSEFEVPLAPRRGIVTWSELEAPLGPRRGVITWSELEIPLAPRRGLVTWSELEVPLAPRQGFVTWAELQIPSINARGLVTWAELEIPLGPRRGIVGWSELEVPLAPRRGLVTWSEIEIPLGPRRGIVTWGELEVPSASGQEKRCSLVWYLGDIA